MEASFNNKFTVVFLLNAVEAVYVFIIYVICRQEYLAFSRCDTNIPRTRAGGIHIPEETTEKRERERER